MPKVKGKSITRDHFEKLNNDAAKCKLREKTVKVGGGTSNMLAHLKRSHPQVAVPVDSEEHAISDSEHRQPSTFTSNNTERGHPPKTIIQSKLKMTMGSNKKKIDEYLTLMIATDFQPFSVVEDKGFKRFVEALNSSYVLPSREKVRYDFMPALYEKVKGKLASLLNNTEYVALTTDLWSNQNMESFITVTVHFFHECKLKSYVLTTSEVYNSHTSENLAEIMKNIITEWKLHNKVAAIVTDNAYNMKKMCDLLEIRHMPCFAHTLNLTVEESLQHAQVEEVIKKCKAVVIFFKKSTVGWRALKSEQIERNPNAQPLKLIQDIATRWNSTLHMLARILKFSDELALVCRKINQSPEFLNSSEEKIAKDVVNILEIFEDATKLVSGDQYPTSSLVIPVICGLFENLNTIEISLETDVGKMFCSAVRRNMSSRLLAYETRTVTQISTYLHPTLRSGFRQTDNMLSAKERVRRELGSLILDSNNTDTQPSSDSVPVTEVATKNPRILDFLKQRRTESGVPNATASAVNIIRMYLETDIGPGREDKHTEVVGIYWENNKHLAPLNKLAFKYLAVPATSVPSERMFSTSGYFLSSRRNRLLSDAVDQLCFIHQNYDLIN